MARFHFHLGFLNSSPLSHRTSGEETQIEVDQSGGAGGREEGGQEYSVMAAVAAVLRRSFVMCSVGAGEEGVGGSMEIGWPTDVQHIAHVTFDRFDGFLGLPLEFCSDIHGKVPSASVSAFGVSAESMQCSHDSRGNSIPTILLTMQRHLYSQGGLKAEGIFRINAENRQEVLAREQLNKGVVPHGVDLHCLAGLIKAWFRELPSGILDSLTPEQVINCNTEEDCCQLVRVLPPTEAALLDWAINLMADVVEHEHHNKMNARNIAMVFAPNMTQMADPLTALIHAVQVMNFLKTLIVRMLREREKAAADGKQFLRSCNLIEVAENSSMDVDGGTSTLGASNLKSFGIFFNIEDCSDSDANESFRSFEKRSEVEDGEFFSGRCSSDLDVVKDGIRCRNGYVDAQSLLNRLNLKEGSTKALQSISVPVD